MKCWIKLKLGQVRSKGRSFDQILEKTFLHSKNYNLIFMKLFKMFMYESRGSLGLGQVELSTRSLVQVLEKSCVYSKGHSFDLIFMKLFEQLEYKSTWPCSKLGHLGQKFRSLGQIIENHIVHIRSKFFSHPCLLS